MILLPLTLCAAACSSITHPSVTEGATGNSYRLVLAKGTRILAPDDATAAQIRAVAVNELVPGTGRELELAQPLQLVSPAYIADRNATEASLLRLIADLKNNQTRALDK